MHTFIFPAARRKALRAGTAAMVGAALPWDCAVAQPSASAGTAAAQRVRGPRIWLDYDQIDLDDGFDTAKVAPNLPQVTGRWATNSAAVRARLGEPRRIAYGPTPIKALDLYTTRSPNAPVSIFVHGGGFNLGAAKNYAFAAEMFVRAGVHQVIPDFARAQDMGGDITPLLEQVRRVVGWVHRNAKGFGGDPDRIYVCGHSSGAELAGLLLTTDWLAEGGLPADVIKGGLCCSAMFDMAGLKLSSRGAGFRFTRESEEALSTRRCIERLRAPVIVAYGSLDTPLFQAQAREFVAAAQAAGKRVELLVAEGYNHFEVIETLANPYGVLGRAVLGQMGITSG